MTVERIDGLKWDISRIKYEHLDRYKYACKRLSKKSVLDVGCGFGYGTKLLNESNTATGIDSSKEAIEYARETYGNNYSISNAEKLQYSDGSFEAVTAFEVLEHVENPEKMLKEIHRVLTPQGKLFISTPNPLHIWNRIKHLFTGKRFDKAFPNPYHVKEFNKQELKELLEKNGFKIKGMVGQSLPPLPGFDRFTKLKITYPIYRLYQLISSYLPGLSTIIIVEAEKSLND